MRLDWTSGAGVHASRALGELNAVGKAETFLLTVGFESGGVEGNGIQHKRKERLCEERPVTGWVAFWPTPRATIFLPRLKCETSPSFALGNTDTDYILHAHRVCKYHPNLSS